MGAVLGIASSAIGIGSSLGLFGGGGGGGSPAQQGQQAQQMTDPFAMYRPQYASQLDKLVQNPASVQQMPGYQAQLQQGTQALQRQAAQQGGTQSGAELMALQDYASGQQNAWYQQQFANLGALSGGTFNPASGGQAGIGAMQQGAQAQSRNIGALGGALGQMGGQLTSLNTAVDYTNPSSTNWLGQSNYVGTPYAGGYQAAPGWFGQ